MLVRPGSLGATLRRATAVLAISLIALPGCSGLRKVERENVPPDQFKSWTDKQTASARKDSPFLKAHMRNGELFVLSDWNTDVSRVFVIGNGTRYDTQRRAIESRLFTVPVDSVALFETNKVKASGAEVVIAILVVATVALAIHCLTDKKACFGSCPTFYIAGTARPVAEGFSASIAPSLEATDLDDIHTVARGGDAFEVTMKNEALETHSVRHVDLLALPRVDGKRAIALADGSFRTALALHAPVSATAAEGDCLSPLLSDDTVERWSPADSANLAARETIDISFTDKRAGDRALVIACRQSLLSTYVLYQTLAYMGSEAGHWIAEIERGRFGDSADELVDMFGGITVGVESSPGTWTRAGEVLEFGPIATDRHALRFQAPEGWTGRVRLELTQGGWRIDQIALAELGAEVEPVRLSPVTVARDGVQDAAALAILRNSTRSLITMPGDTYSLMYAVPDDAEFYDVFLESRGYYLEWMREEWVKEESAERLAEVFVNPAQALARMAPAYKELEPRMEAAFWGSRYAK